MKLRSKRRKPQAKKIAKQLIKAINEPSRLLQCLKVTKVDDPPILLQKGYAASETLGTSLNPVPPLVCEVCFLIDGDGRECGCKPDTAKCPECDQCYFLCKCTWPETLEVG